MWPYRDSLAPSASGWRKPANVSETSPTKRRAGKEEQEKRRGKRPFFLLAWYSAVAAVSQIPLIIQASIQTFPGHPLCARQIRIPGGGGDTEVGRGDGDTRVKSQCLFPRGPAIRPWQTSVPRGSAHPQRALLLVASLPAQTFS